MADVSRTRISPREHLFALIGFTVLTVAMTWPVAALFDRGINAFGDVVLQMTAMTWDAHALATNPLGIFDAPFFYPYAHSNAYSEHLIGETLVALPLFWLAGSDPAPAHNFNFLLSFVLTGYGTYLLTRDVTGSRAAAWAAGIAYAFTGYRFVQSGHLNVLATQWFPLTLWALRRGLIRNHGGYLAAAAFFVVCMGLFSVYFLYFLALLVVLYLAWWMLGGRRAAEGAGGGDRGSDDSIQNSEFRIQNSEFNKIRNPQSAIRTRWGKLLLTGLGAGLVLLPFYLPYLAVNRELGLERSPYEVQGFAAHAGFFINVLPTNWLWATLLPDLMVSNRGERQMFPGALITLLAVAAFVVRASRQSYPYGTAPRSVVSRVPAGPLRDQSSVSDESASAIQEPGTQNTQHATRNTQRISRFTFHVSRFLTSERGFYLILLVVAVIMTYGISYRLPGVGWDVPLPYGWLFDWVPGWAALRVPVRFAVLVDLALAVLGGMGLAAILARRPRWQWAVVPLLALMLLEYVQVRDLRNNREMRPADAQPYTWLADHPGPVIELPMTGDNFADVWQTYWATYNWQPLVSGAGSFIPPGTAAIAKAMQTFPDAKSITLLQGLEIRHVILHTSQYSEADRRALAARLGRIPVLKKVFAAGDAEVYEVQPDPWMRQIVQKLPAGGQLWIARGAENRAPALETLAYGLQYGRLPAALLPNGASVTGDLTIGTRLLPPLPLGRPADLTLLPTGDPVSRDTALLGTPVYTNALVTLYQRDPNLVFRYDFTAPNARTTPHGQALPQSMTVGFTMDEFDKALAAKLQEKNYYREFLFAAFGDEQLQVDGQAIPLTPGLTRYLDPPGGGLTAAINASGNGGAPLLLRYDARLVDPATAPVSSTIPLTNTLVMDVDASTVDFKAGTITSAWRVVPEYPGSDPLTLSLDVYQKPFGRHPDGHLGTWSLPLPAGTDGRRFTITLNPVAKAATATLNGGGAQVFAWTGPPHSDEFTATLNLYAGDRLLKGVPVYEFTLKADKLVDFQPAPGALVVLPFAAP